MTADRRHISDLRVALAEVLSADEGGTVLTGGERLVVQSMCDEILALDRCLAADHDKLGCQIVVRVTPDMYRELRAAAEGEHVSMGEHVRRTLRAALGDPAPVCTEQPGCPAHPEMTVEHRVKGGAPSRSVEADECWVCRVSFDEDETLRRAVYASLAEDPTGEAAKVKIRELLAAEHAGHQLSWISDDVPSRG